MAASPKEYREFAKDCLRGACPSRKSYPRVFVMQAGQDWCGDDGPRSLDGSS